MSIFDEIITSSSFDESQGEFPVVAIVQQLVTILAMIRSAAHETPEYSEEAIYHARTFTGPTKIVLRNSPRSSASVTSVPSKAPKRPLAQPAPVVSFRDHDDPEIDPTFEKLGLLEGLLSVIRDDDLTEINEAIEKG
ncbi:hypothetical protein EDB84DRAFT_1568140 [Lactarius hengduanensis]|nr:hypothetical protein EDB84DRAFT_1568140 [Lactarius hengduanensis]